MVASASFNYNLRKWRENLPIIGNHEGNDLLKESIPYEGEKYLWIWRG